MKSLFLAGCAALVLLPFGANAQEYPSIGSLPLVEDSRPMQFAISGYEIITFRNGDGNQSPFVRSAVCDARLSAILSRTQEQPLRSSEVRATTKNGRHFVMIRQFILAEVKPQDARAVKMSMTALAKQWANKTRRVLPQILPTPGRYGI